MGSGTLSLPTDLQPSTINLNHCECWARLDVGLECVGLKLFYLLVPLNL